MALRTSRPPTAEDIQKAEIRVLKAIREGAHKLSEIMLETATLQLSTGVSRERAVRRALASLKSRGTIETAPNNGWYEVGVQLKRVEAQHKPEYTITRFAPRRGYG